MTPDPTTPSPSGHNSEPPSASALDGEGTGVLIVDDSDLMCQVIYRLLSSNGYIVKSVVTSGADALRAYDLVQPGLVTLDLQMPGISGKDTLTRLLRKDPEAKVVIISAASETPEVLECLKLGARGYVIKPFQEQKLLETLHRARKQP